MHPVLLACILNPGKHAVQVLESLHAAHPKEQFVHYKVAIEKYLFI